jgi:hypothetical protein
MTNDQAPNHKQTLITKLECSDGYKLWSIEIQAFVLVWSLVIGHW